jgi:hypothetical protein
MQKKKKKIKKISTKKTAPSETESIKALKEKIKHQKDALNKIIKKYSK